MQMVRIIKPGEGEEPDLEATVPASSLPHHYRAGWTRLDESPEPAEETPPKPVRRKKQAAAQQDAGATDDSDQESE